MSKLGKIVVYRNVSPINQTVLVNGHWVTVIPGGTVEDHERGAISRNRLFKKAPEVVPTPDHEATMANANANKEVQTAQSFPVHLGGGKWKLSNGEETEAGLKRAVAEELQAAVDAAAKVAEEEG